MEYNIKRNAKVILNVLAGADKSMVGLRFGQNTSIIEISEEDFTQIMLMTRSKKEYNAYSYDIFKHRARIANDSKNASFIVMETIKTTENMIEDYVIACDLFKFYKAKDIYSCYQLDYQCNNEINTVRGSGEVRIVKYEHAVDHLPRSYSLSDEEKENFKEWYNSHVGLVVGLKNQNLKKMIDLYLDSYLVGKVNPSFIMLFVVLEMVYGVNKTDISKNIRKGVSKFLGNNSKEREKIYNDIYKLYDDRCKYVHAGVDVDWDSLFLLRDYVRRVIVKLYDNSKS